MININDPEDTTEDQAATEAEQQPAVSSVPLEYPGEGALEPHPNPIDEGSF